MKIFEAAIKEATAIEENKTSHERRSEMNANNYNE